MKQTPKFFLFLAILSGFATLSYAAHHEEGEDHSDESPLHEEMEAMDDAFKPLFRAMRNPDPADKEQYLEWLQTMQLHAVKSKVYVPRHVSELPEAEAAEMLVGYRVDMTKFIDTLMELERAIVQDDWDAAKSVAASLRQHRKDGHGTYDPE